MRDMLALTRYAITQNRYLISFFLVAVVTGEVSALIAVPYIPKIGDALPVMAIFLGLVPASVAALALFDYGHQTDLMSAESGCGQWMLRMPIASWKLAIVPIVLKTIWVSTLWILFVSSIQYLAGAGSTSVGYGCVFFSAAVIWLLAIGWRPFRSGWHRIGVLFIVAIVFYLGLILVLVPYDSEWIAWQPWAVAGSYLLAVSLYVSGVWFTIRSTELARTACWGLIPEHGRQLAHGPQKEYGVRDHATARRALVWHDLERAKAFIMYTLLLGVLPTILITTFLVPMKGATVGFVLFLFIYFSGVAVCGIGAVQGSKWALPPYLASSPLSTATIAWTRLLVIVAVAAAVSLCVILVFIGWSCWPENRAAWLTWASRQAYSLQSSSSPVAIGVRYSVAIVIGCLVFGWGRIVSFLWVSMAGREWFNTLFAVVLTLLFLLPAVVFLGWFMQQTDWETTNHTIYGWLSWTPNLIAGLLALKAICVSIASFAIWRSRATSHENVLKAIAGWCVVTISIAVTVFVLIPDPRATFLLCLVGTVLAIPLARVLVLPVSLAYNRHR